MVSKCCDTEIVVIHKPCIVDFYYKILWYNGNMFTLHWYDVVKALVVAVITGAFLSIVGVFGNDFDVFTADWTSIGKSAVNGGFAALVGYIVKNFLTADNGKIAGIL